MQERIDQCKQNGLEKIAHQKFKDLIKPMSNKDLDSYKTNRDKLLLAAKVFYDNAEGEQPWVNMRPQFMEIGWDELKEIVIEIAGEGINRDMIQYIKTGKRGDLGARMYRAIQGTLKV